MTNVLFVPNYEDMFPYLINPDKRKEEPKELTAIKEQIGEGFRLATKEVWRTHFEPKPLHWEDSCLGLNYEILESPGDLLISEERNLGLIVFDHTAIHTMGASGYIHDLTEDFAKEKNVDMAKLKNLPPCVDVRGIPTVIVCRSKFAQSLTLEDIQAFNIAAVLRDDIQKGGKPDDPYNPERLALLLLAFKDAKDSIGLKMADVPVFMGTFQKSLKRRIDENIYRVIEASGAVRRDPGPQSRELIYIPFLSRPIGSYDHIAKGL